MANLVLPEWLTALATISLALKSDTPAVPPADSAVLGAQIGSALITALSGSGPSYSTQKQHFSDLRALLNEIMAPYLEARRVAVTANNAWTAPVVLNQACSQIHSYLLNEENALRNSIFLYQNPMTSVSDFSDTAVASAHANVTDWVTTTHTAVTAANTATDADWVSFTTDFVPV